MKKVIVQIKKGTRKDLATIEKHCKKVLANYGKSMLILVNDNDLKTLQEKQYRTRILEKPSTANIRGHKVDTSRKVRLTSNIIGKLNMQTGRSCHILDLVGPMHKDWKKTLEKMGVIIHQKLNDDYYIISIDSNEIKNIPSLVFVESLLPYVPALKINPSLLTKDLQKNINKIIGTSLLKPKLREKDITKDKTEVIDVFGKKQPIKKLNIEKEGNLELVPFDSKDRMIIMDAVHALGVSIIKGGKKSIVVYAKPQLLFKLASIPEVYAINPYKRPTLTNNVATGIIRANILHNNTGLDGSGQIIAVADSGLDNGINDNTMLSDFRGRIVGIHALGRVNDASDIHNHGTHVAGSVLGDGSNSNGNIRGIAPAASLVFQSHMSADRSLGGLPDDLADLFQQALDDGAQIHTNSWGAPVDGDYNGNSTETDDFAFNNREFLILFSAGNEGGTTDDRVGSPGTAKNVLTIGASESVRPLPTSVQFPNSPSFPATDFPGGPVWSNFDQQADNNNEIASFSSIGPVENNRIKPDVVAPGSWILSTRSSESTDDTGPDGLPGTGDENGNFSHTEAVAEGLPGQPIFGGGDQNTPAAPAGSGLAVVQNYCYMSGTSMATPITAGACALIRQYLIEQRGHAPSAALLKALMVNGAADMGMGIPDNGQGWGRINLENTIFPPGTNIVQFDDTLDNAVETGEIKSYDVHVSSSSNPLTVTLVWRDFSGDTIQNSLHLRVTHVVSGVVSTSDNIADIRNNVQKVVIDVPQPGNYQIEVEGVNITSGIPEFPGDIRQDYALVVAGATGYSCNPSDIVQVIDRSGSMGYFGYMEPAKERAKQLVDILQINDKIGIVSFATSAQEDHPLTQITSQDDKNDAHDAITPINSAGNTDLREGLDDGLNTLGPDVGRPRAMVFLSDGHHTVSTPSIDDAFLDTIAASNVKVYTIALGPDSDFAVLNNIASRTGTGAVNTVESAADIHKLHEIYYSILGNVGCGGVVHLQSASIDIQNGLTQLVDIDTTVRQAHFAISWGSPNNKVDYTLQDPFGKTYTKNSKESFHYEGSTHQFYRISKPKAGKWKMIIRARNLDGTTPMMITSAALADSDIRCKAELDQKYLFHGKVLLKLKAFYGKRILREGTASANITYPTISTESLLKKYSSQLKRIKLDSKKLKKDTINANLAKLGILASSYQKEGKDIFARKTIKVELKDRFDNGTYAVLLDPKKLHIAGNFQAKTSFFIKDEKFGTHTCHRLIPVYIPTLSDILELKIEKIVVSVDKLKRNLIIGVRVLKPKDNPISPSDKLKLVMEITQNEHKIKTSKFKFDRRTEMFNTRLSLTQLEKLGFKTGKAKVEFQAILGNSKAEKTMQINIPKRKNIFIVKPVKKRKPLLKSKKIKSKNKTPDTK